MKLITSLVLFAVLTGCKESNQSVNNLHTRFEEAIRLHDKSISKGNLDSAFFYCGKMEAFYEAMYGESPNPLQSYLPSKNDSFRGNHKDNLFVGSDSIHTMVTIPLHAEEDTNFNHGLSWYEVHKNRFGDSVALMPKNAKRVQRKPKPKIKMIPKETCLHEIVDNTAMECVGGWKCNTCRCVQCGKKWACY